MIKKTVALLFSILMLLMVFAGCWSYVEIDALFVAMGVIIDYDEETDEYIMITEVAKSKGGTSEQLMSRVEAFRGATLFEATRNAVAKIGAKLYWGHIMFYALSEKVAKMGIADALSLAYLQTQMRSDTFVFIVEDDSVEDFFKFKDPIHESISEHVHDLVEAYKVSGKFRSTPMYKILQELESDEVSLILPVMKVVKEESRTEQQESGSEGGSSDASSSQQSSEGTEQKEIILLVEGSKVFKKDVMIGEFTDLDTRCAMILKKEISNNYIITHSKEGEIPACSVEVINSKSSIKTDLSDGDKLSIYVTFELEGDLVELQSKLDYISDISKGILEQAFNEMLERQLIEAINKSQQFKSDVFGIAGFVHRSSPDKYAQIKNIFESVLQEANVYVNVNLTIKSSSLAMEPLEAGS